MAQQLINVGNVANDGQGDPLRTAFIKTNDNFTELYNIGGLTGIQNGNSNITIAANSTINMAVTGTPNVVVVYDTGLTVTGVIQADEISSVGNVYSDYYLGNGALLSGLSALSANALTGTTLAASVVNSSLTQLGVLSALSVAGNITGANSANIIVGLRAGNITTPGTLNVTQGASFGSDIAAVGTISTTGNIVGNNIIGSFSFASLSTAGNVIGGNLVTSGLVTATGSAIVGNLVTVGLVTATGNITGNYIIGNGALLTGLPASYSNANVAAYLPTYSGALTASTLSLSGNIVSAINTTSNVTAPFYLGNGSLLTGVTATSIGTLPSLSVSGNAVIDGTLNSSTVTTGAIRGSTLSLSGQVLSPINSSSDISTSGNIFGAQGQIGLLSVVSNVTIGGAVNASGNITGSNLSVTGAVIATNQLRVPGAGNSIWTAGNVSGSNLNATAGIYAGGVVSATGTATAGNFITGGIVSAVGNITGGNLAIGGNISGGNLSLTGAINSGSLTSTSTVTAGNVLTGGIVSASGNITAGPGSYFIGTFLGNISGNLVVPGANTQVLYNNNGNAGASAGLTYDASANLLVTGNVFADFLYGNGAALTGIVATEIGTLTSLSVSGTTTTGNLSVVGNVLGNLNVSTIVNAANIVTANVLAGEIYCDTTFSGTNVFADGQIATSSGGNAIYAVGNITGGNIIAITSISTTGNIRGSNIVATTVISSTGNINTAGNINAAGIVYSANIVTANVLVDEIYCNNTFFGTDVFVDGQFATSSGGNAIFAVGNITGGNILTGNAVSAGGNVIGNNISTSGLVTATGNIVSGNVRTSGLVTATGNVVGNNLVATNLVVFSSLGSDPPGVTGAIYFSTLYSKFRGYNGTVWANLTLT